MNNIQFGKLVNCLTIWGMRELSIEEMRELNNMVVSEPNPQVINVQAIDALLKAVFEGSSKIEAIKLYRTITGAYLKEAKDAVEKHWPVKNEG